MPFADEPWGYHHDRKFLCGWTSRRESATQIAVRAQEFARRLQAIDPVFAGLGRNRRRKRRDDYGAPIIDITPSQLAQQIDRYDRFDPPPYPAPVDATGYSSMFGNGLGIDDPLRLSGFFHVGVHEASRMENYVEMFPHPDHPVWRDVDWGLQFLSALVECWDAEWGGAYQSIKDGEDGRPRVRPWLAWTAEPLKPRPAPLRAYPFPFPLDYAGPPAETRPWWGGELSIWP